MNAMEGEGIAPLHIAASWGFAETVRVLVKELGADLNAKDNDGMIPFDHVGEDEHQEELKALLLQ